MALLDKSFSQVEDSAVAKFPQLAGNEQLRLGWMLRSFYEPTWRVARRLGLTGAQSDEIAQEAFMVVARKLAQIESGHERAFVLGVAIRLANNERRRAAQRFERVNEHADAPEPVDRQPLAEQAMALKQRCEQLDRILDSMSSLLREVLLLYEIEELTLPEIAEALEIPQGTVASRLRRARVEFRRRARAHAELEEP